MIGTLRRLWTERPPRPVVTEPKQQVDPLECGPVSLFIVLAHHGRHVPLVELRQQCGVSRNGSKASAIVKTARAHGLTAKGLSMPVERLRKVVPPAILFVDMAHFLVFEGMRRGRFLVNDPAGGRYSLSRDDMERRFSGVVLSLAKADGFEPQRRPPGFAAAVARLTRGLRGGAALAAFVGIALVLPGIVIPALTKIFVDDYLLGGQIHWGQTIVAAAAGLVVLQLGLAFLNERLSDRMSVQLGARTATEYVWSLMRMPLAFYGQRATGGLAGRVEQTALLGSLPSETLVPIVVSSGALLFFGLVMLSYSVPLALLVFGFATVSVLLSSRTARPLVDLHRSVAEETMKSQGKLLQAMSMGEAIKVNGLGEMVFQLWAGSHARLVTASQRLGRLQAALGLIPEAIVTAARIGTVVLGAALVLRGETTVGTIVAFLTLQASFLAPLARLQGAVNALPQARAAVEQIEDVTTLPHDREFARPDEDGEKLAATALGTVGKLPGRIEMRGVVYGFSTAEPAILQGVDISAEPGEWVALVGPSGSGKSTIGHLASGLDRPWKGEIHIAGHPLADIPRRRLRRSLAVVNQNVHIFPGTVAENISMWDATMPEEVIVAAARDAELHDDIVARAGGYGGTLAEGGRDLSGGQRQRLEIARALAMEPTIMILDEATSALDPVIEARVIENLRRRGCTCLVIAHRLSTIRDADRIVVLEAGKVVERGRHDDLLAAGGLYARLVGA
ncbi:MAG: ATP-binding cassette domain-containing protein [Shimia sp.]